MEKYKIIVSEPWNFCNAKGENLIIGEIKKVLSPSFIIFESDNMLDFESNVGRLLILKPRYEKQILHKGNAYEGTVTGGLLLNENYEDKNEKYLETNSKYVIIGSLSKK